MTDDHLLIKPKSPTVEPKPMEMEEVYNLSKTMLIQLPGPQDAAQVMLNLILMLSMHTNVKDIDIYLTSLGSAFKSVYVNSGSTHFGKVTLPTEH